MEIELKKSNYSKVKELAENFSKICKNYVIKKFNFRIFKKFGTKK